MSLTKERRDDIRKICIRYASDALRIDVLALLDALEESELVLAEERQINADNRRQIRGLQAQLAAAQETIARLEKVLKGDALIESIHYEAGGALSLAMTHPIQASMIAGFVDMLDQSKAENYLEVQMTDKEGKRYVCTVQRAEKPTSHELRRKAEADLATLRTTYEKTVEALKAILDECDNPETQSNIPPRLFTQAQHALGERKGDG